MLGILCASRLHMGAMKCNTAHLDCSLPTESMTLESLLCVGLTESRTQHRWVVEYESDSHHFLRRDACESLQSPSGNGP